MRLLCSFVLTAFLWVLFVACGGGSASAFVHVTPPSSGQRLLLDAKFVCGMTPDGFKCRRESGATRKSGKAPKIPGSSSSGSSEALTDSSDEDALPPASGDTGYAAPPPAATAVPTTCPENSELLGGHCIPYTQRCTTGIAPNAYPPQCRGAEEKQVCNFRPDGTKDCCCRTYAKF
jgi:hypothetical protein